MNGQFLSRFAMPQPQSCPNFSKSALDLIFPGRLPTEGNDLPTVCPEES
jgi:hypothetical protein